MTVRQHIAGFLEDLGSSQSTLLVFCLVILALFFVMALLLSDRLKKSRDRARRSRQE